MQADPAIVGRRLPRVDGISKATGAAQFSADVTIPGALASGYVPSPYPRAEIVAIDTSAAEAMPGVHAVATAADLPPLPADWNGSRNQVPLARGVTAFVGQPVVAVAGDDAATVDLALDRVRISYRQLRPVVTVAAALDEDSPPVCPRPGLGEGNGNIVHRLETDAGDLRGALAGAASVRTASFRWPSLHQAYLEPHAAVARWTGDGTLEIWTSLQGAAVGTGQVAACLGIDPERVRIFATEIGGGFGGKTREFLSPIAALLARKAGRPVKIVMTRRDEMTAANPAPEIGIDMTLGVAADGSFRALDVAVTLNAGAFVPPYPNSHTVASMHRSRYRFGAERMSAREVLTNTVPYGAYRAPGGAAATFALECMVDEVAAELGMDPIELRMRNLLREGDPLPGGGTMPVHGGKGVLEALAGHPVWTERPAASPGWLRGRGMALGHWRSGQWPAGAIATLDADGRVHVVLATVDLTGSYTSLAQLAAETFGVELDRVVMEKTTQDLALPAPPAGGSGTIYSVGAAVVGAVRRLRAEVAGVGAAILECAVDDLAWNATGLDAGNGRAVEFAEVAARSPGLRGEEMLKPAEYAPVFAATAADVSVDPLTGKVTVNRLVTVQDVGRAINPVAVEGQIQGATAQAVGLALWECLARGDDGGVTATGFTRYLLPTAADLPPIDVVVIECPGGDGPLGARGVGEAPITPGAAAVANAICDATGFRPRALPMTPERVWRGMNGLDPGSAWTAGGQRSTRVNGGRVTDAGRRLR